MSLDKTTIAKIADLARIAVPADELAPLAQELSAILGWIEQLNEVDTDDVAPMRAVMPIQTCLRADVVDDGDCRSAVLANAPAEQDGYFLVPKVVE